MLLVSSYNLTKLVLTGLQRNRIKNVLKRYLIVIRFDENNVKSSNNKINLYFVIAYNHITISYRGIYYAKKIVIV